MKKFTLLFILCGFLSISVLAQDAAPSLKYSAFRLNAQLNNYFKGETSDEFGADKIEPRSMLSWSAGLDYLPKLSQNVYGIVGFHVNMEPAMSFTDYPTQDIAGSDYLPMDNKFYGFYSLSMPIGFGIQSPLKNNKIGLQFEGCFVPMFYAQGGVSGSFATYDEAGDSSRVFLETTSETTQDGWYYQARFSGGVYLNTNAGKISARLVWNATFQNLMEGDYSYYDSNGDVVSGGNYALSGNYLGLAVGYQFKKRNKLEKSKI